MVTDPISDAHAMIKLVIDRTDGPLYAFGLSAGNVRRLKAGEPIAVDLSPMGGRGRILIFYGATERQMMAELREFIGPETKVHVDPRLADS